MRIVVFGAGAVGGVIGGRLHQAGTDVVLVARGAHHDAIRDHGLRLVAGEAVAVLDVPVVDGPAAITWRRDDVVLLAVKTQDSEGALEALAAAAPVDVPIVCAQNGVENERLALRRFPRVSGMCVMCPTGHLEPGVVQAYSTPISGLLDLGTYPFGVSDVDRDVAAVLETATFESVPRPDIMRWKYAKLLLNLGNAVQALCGADLTGDASREVARRARAEGDAVLAAAGIDVAPPQDDLDRRGDKLQVGPVGTRTSPGGSTWQSLARGAGSVETDHLNGEIVLLGRLHGVPTPVNAVLQRWCAAAARDGRPSGTTTPDEILTAAHADA
jgi:2-dehydropantoate 2-reductase